jgi:AcrR family transcriptional regulator
MSTTRRLSRLESREQTRRRLLAAAARLFARHGYQATSVDDIAEAAGFSKGAVYYNFESKDELFEALVGELIDELTTSLEAALAGAHTIDEKLDVARRMLTERERLEKGQPHLELEILMQAVREPKLRKKVTEAYARMRAAVAGLIAEQFAEAGVRPPLDPGALASAIVAAGIGHGVMESLDPSAVPPGLFPSVLALLLRPSG